jgi:predicted DNA-binding transcriptional regulator AlpA
MNTNEHYMTWDDVCLVVNRTKPTIWRWVQKGAFPKPKYRKADGLLIGFARNEIEHYCRTGEVLQQK